MVLEFSCPHCGAVLHAPRNAAGQHVRCRECHHVVVVHAEGPLTAGEPSPESQPSAGSATKPPPPSVRAPASDAVHELFEEALTAKTPTVRPREHLHLPGAGDLLAATLGTGQRHERHLPHVADAGHRDGPPWERDGRSTGSFLATLWQAYSWKHYLFHYLHPFRSATDPVWFALWAAIPTAMVWKLLHVPDTIPPIDGQAPTATALAVAAAAGWLVLWAVLAAVGLVMLAAAAAVVYHAMLLVLRVAQYGLLATLRMNWYVVGAVVWWWGIPRIGEFAGPVVALAMTVCAVRQMHHTSIVAALTTVLLPTAAVAAIGLGLHAAGFFAGGAAS
jgi:hypothetical protein